jgi:rubrerythrin
MMAIGGYERYIQSVNDPGVKKELQRIQQEHKQHAIKIAERIQNLGGKPVEDVGVFGKMAETVSGIKDIGLKETKDILKEAYNGENNGIGMADELVKGDLDSGSRLMVNDILDDDRNHLDILGSMIKNNSIIH